MHLGKRFRGIRLNQRFFSFLLVPVVLLPYGFLKRLFIQLLSRDWYKVNPIRNIRFWLRRSWLSGIRINHNWVFLPDLATFLPMFWTLLLYTSCSLTSLNTKFFKRNEPITLPDSMDSRSEVGEWSRSYECFLMRFVSHGWSILLRDWWLSY